MRDFHVFKVTEPENGYFLYVVSLLNKPELVLEQTESSSLTVYRFLVEWTRNFLKYTSIKLVGLPVNLFLANLFNTTILK